MPLIGPGPKPTTSSKSTFRRKLAAKPVQPKPPTDSTATFKRKLAAKPVQPKQPKPTFVSPVPLGDPAPPGTPSTVARGAPTAVGPQPWIDYVPTYAGGPGPGGAAPPAQQTSVTDSEADKKRQAEEDAAREAAVTAADEALERQLKAIEAEFGMTREELERDEGEAGRQYRQALAGLLLERDANIEASLNEMIERGIIQSGITLQHQADVQEAFARQKAAASGDLDYVRAGIAAERAALDPRQKAAEAAATAEHERTLRDLELMRAAAEGGI